jgi:hypothetical protein
MSQKKVEKKVVFVFTNFFFKIDFGHFFMSNFKIKKKVLKFVSFLLFLPIFNYLKNTIYPFKINFSYFFYENSHFERNF